jgi:hypothetical protein
MWASLGYMWLLWVPSLGVPTAEQVVIVYLSRKTSRRGDRGGWLQPDHTGSSGPMGEARLLRSCWSEELGLGPWTRPWG